MEPIKRKSLAQEVADVLRHKIRSGAIKVGSKLPAEPELMQSLEVGRSTVREAIKYLDQSGFVKAQQGIGTIVISSVGNNPLEDVIENSKFIDVFEVRKLIEYKIVEEAARHRKQAHIKVMRQNLDNRQKYGELGMLKECVEADIAFHISVAEACGNPILSELYRTLSVHITKFFLRDYDDASRPLRSQDLHEELLQNIIDQDSDKAVSTSKKLIGEI